MPTKPRHGDITRDLMAAIRTGHYPVGSVLPTELRLCEQYRTSRHTVRVALQELQRLGLVSRRKNAGTRVEAAEPVSSFRPTLASVDDLVQFGSAHVRTVKSAGPVTADASLARELGCPRGQPWLRITSMRQESHDVGAPIALTDTYLDPQYTDIVDLVRATPDTLISDLIASRYGRRIAEIQQDIHAINMNIRQARSLAAKPGAAALKIVRRYLDDSNTVYEITVTIHPADRFAVSMRLKAPAP